MHFYRPNRLMTKKEQEYGEDDVRQGIYRSREKIEEIMKNKDRKFIQWAPSRDWSRLFVLSSTPDDGRTVVLYLEFYNFSNDKQTILSSPIRINFLSQLLRPQMIQSVTCIPQSDASELNIEAASFTADTIVIRASKTDFLIINLNTDWEIEQQRWFKIENAGIESVTLSCSKLFLKFNEFYYEQYVTEISKDKQSRDKDFSKSTTLNNIIQCGIYDILIYDGHVKICSNIEPLNQFDQREVDADILKSLKQSKFIQLDSKNIQLDNNQIACLLQPLNDKAFPLLIINISQDKPVNLCKGYDSGNIQFKSPWNTQPSDCVFNLVKLKDQQYAVLIVSSASKKELYFQMYNYHGDYVFEYQKPLIDHINLQQIPHLPLVAINGSLIINTNLYYDQLELDLRLDEAEILSQDQENINSQEVDVYSKHFKGYLFTCIENKSDIIDLQTKSYRILNSIEIPELRTVIIINSGGENIEFIILKHSFEKIKHVKINMPVRYKTHQVIYQDSLYKANIILSSDDALYGIQLSFDNLGVITFKPLKLIMNFTEAQKEHEIYLHDDFSVSMFIPEPECCFKHFSLNQKGQQEETIKFDFTIPKLSSFIKRIASSQSISLKDLFLEKFKSIIFKNTGGFMKIGYDTSVFAFNNKIILFEKLVNNLIIMDDAFAVIGTVILSSKFPPLIIRIASSIESGALEYIDQLSRKFPLPILGNLQEYKSYNNRLHSYGTIFNYPLPIQFGLLDGFIAHLDLHAQKLLFYKSEQDYKDGNIATRIEVIAQRDSFIDQIINSKERKDIEQQMNKIEISQLLSYNLNKNMNLITGTKKHAEKDHIYSVLYKLLEIAEIKELPLLVYNTSLEPNKYETILDILIENKAFKLAQLIVSIAIKQDQIGYIYSRLYEYLSIFSANELQIFFENQIFFFKIPQDCFEEYQVVENSIIKPISNYKTFYEIKKNMKNVERQILRIEEHKARTDKKDTDSQIENQIEEFKDEVEEIKDLNHQPGLENEKDQLQISEKFLEDEEVGVPTEYFAINLMNLIQSRNQSLNENHSEVTRMLNKIVEADESIIEKESFQIIIDFKWDSYAQKFFSVQLGLFICFIIAFILDVMAVSKNSHVFSSDDQNQIIPRIISIATLIPFAIYEIANFVATRQTYFKGFWNFNDCLLIALYFTYFTTTFARPEQKDFLKTLQLLIVIFTFLKFSFLIRIVPKVSFLVEMLIDVIQAILIFLLYFLLVIVGFTIMAFIIMVESGEAYNGIKSVAYFVIILRQSVGDYDTSSIIDGSKEFQVLAWFLWFIILIIGNIVFMNFIIAVVSESYESCMERKVQLIYKAKLEMITECEDLMPEWLFTKKNWFPRFIIIRREQGSGAGGDNSDEWQGFVKQMKRHLQHETTMLKEILNRSTESSKKEIKNTQEEVKKVTAEMKNTQEEVKKVTEITAEMKTGQEEMKKDTAEMKVQINQINLILSAVFKEQIAAMKPQEDQANDNKAI